MKRFLLSAALLLACSGVALAQESEFSGGGGGGITAAPGSGTAGRVPQFASTTSLEDSKMTTSGTNSGTWTLYDNTAVTGLTKLVITGGAGQVSTPHFKVEGVAGGNNLSIRYGDPEGLASMILASGDGVGGLYGLAIQTSAFAQYITSGGVWSLNISGIENNTWSVSGATGHLIPAGDGTHDFGASGNRVGNIYAAGMAVSDSATNTVSDALILRHATSGTAAASFGTGLLFQGEDGAGNMQDMASIDAVYTDATNGSEDTDVVLRGFKAGAELEFMRFREGYMGTVASISINSIGGSIDLRSAGVLYISPSGLGAGWVVNDPALAPYYTNTYDIGTSSLLVRNNYVSTSIQGVRAEVIPSDNVAENFVVITSAVSDAVTGGYIEYTVTAVDTTNHIIQTETGVVPFVAVNENGTVTASLGTPYGVHQDNAGGGALVVSFGSSVATTNVTFTVTSNYDEATLTGTVVNTMRYRVVLTSGTATVTPQT